MDLWTLGTGDIVICNIRAKSLHRSWAAACKVQSPSHHRHILAKYLHIYTQVSISVSTHIYTSISVSTQAMGGVAEVWGAARCVPVCPVLYRPRQAEAASSASSPPASVPAPWYQCSAVTGVWHGLS